MYFEVIGDIMEVEVIAVGNAIRELARLERDFGKARWRKLKGIASVRLVNDHVRLAEVHWYEAHGVGRRLMKIKRFVD